MAQRSTPEYEIGDMVPYHFMPGLIVASYFVSLVGAVTTVELLHRRKSGSDWRSWLQLGACAISFGLCAIWCMHFVGNRAIVLGNGQKQMQLFYSPGFTALSVFLPIVFLFFGFAFADNKVKVLHRFFAGNKSLYLRFIGCGIVAGLAITGMHYVGNFGAANYKLYNKTGFVIGAACIAMASCSLALTLFFRWKELWINIWWRRLICACGLAGAVTGMHFVASLGTTYQLVDLKQNSSNDLNTNMIVAVALSLGACVVCIVLFGLIHHRKRQLADRAQHVVLAVATFDPDGRLLVTQEGLMPCQKITKQYNQQSFDDEFNVAHPVFQWIFRVSHNWYGIADLISSMRNHLRATGGLKNPSRPGSKSSVNSDGSELEQDYSVIFRERFCVAASVLAENLQTPLHNIGILYDEIMMTGTFSGDPKGGRRLPSSQRRHKAMDVEANSTLPTLFGKGQLLFVVRQVDKHESGRLESVGYRFATLDHIGEILARSMQVSRQDLSDTVRRLRTYSRYEELGSKAGVHVGCFALQPAVKSSDRDWNVLVQKDERGQLPMVHLTDQTLTAWQKMFLLGLDGGTVGQLLQLLPLKAAEKKDPQERIFIEILSTRINMLTNMVPEPFFRQAIFSSKLIELGDESDSLMTPMSLLVFCIIPDVHSASIKNTDKLAYTPLSFFTCRQHVKKNSPDHSIMARRIHKEFGPLLSQAEYLINPGSEKRRNSLKDITPTRKANSPSLFSSLFKSKPKRSKGGRHLSSRSTTSSRSDSGNNLCPKGDEQAMTGAHAGAFGGIMVSSDVSWTVDSPCSPNQQATELNELGMHSEAGVAASEQPTFVSELFHTACSLWQRS